jgi:hypothetical protein
MTTHKDRSGARESYLERRERVALPAFPSRSHVVAFGGGVAVLRSRSLQWGAASEGLVRNLEQGAGLICVETEDPEFGFWMQVDDPKESSGYGVLYQGPSGFAFDKWAHGFCVGRGLL